MILQNDQTFILATKNTTYVFSMLESGHLEHLYYGRRLEQPSAEIFRQKRAFEPGNSIVYDDAHKNLILEDICLEMSASGKGDIGESFLEIEHADGSVTSDFLFEKAQIMDDKKALTSLPSAYDESQKIQQLIVTLKDASYDLQLQLRYEVYEECDCIVRTAVLVNSSNETIRLHKMMSNQLDLARGTYAITSFHGAWAREMQKHTVMAGPGNYINSSFTGTSSNRSNPFTMLHEVHATEDAGMCYGFNLIYSGNHYTSVSQNAYGKTRLVSGINPRGFSFVLEPGDVFEAPEAVMTCSYEGFTKMSHNMHEFVQEHVVRGEWKKKERPILLNSWEAAYFDIKESSLLKMAKEAKNVGIELFVMDDGWFGQRNDDAHALGDWKVNTEKLPGGLGGICKKINEMGLDFGIWVEPEMVNVESDLYREHPDWTIDIPLKPHSQGRNQRLLDLTRPQVQQYIIEQMSEVFESANIKYVKWDMNRIFSDVYSRYLPAERQGEVFHRYVMGLYRIMKTLTEKFAYILFEGCAAGGNRFDLGILSFFPQIWASDDTDAIARSYIQEGYSYGYPLSAISAHVSSCPNHQTLRVTPMATRFNVAAYGVLGYECNLSDLTKEDLDAIREQIDTYKKFRSTFQYGKFYRGRSGRIHEWTCVNENKEQAVGMLLQEQVIANTQAESYQAKGLLPQGLYHFYNKKRKYDVRKFGDLINTQAPFHIKQGSLVHNVVARFVTMYGEQEDYTVTGENLMYAGVTLKDAFAGTGYSEEVRYFQDYSSRMYYMELVKE
ncbi:alpha-galactosidase [Eubacterium oxidoreducens]|uniref:Alpha-galactosidase n=1 Tax=Eubacterium oxidoreducens TaxID=1732 RepID=A0A1G6CGX6_EUBOX|nr:alpha-galactosidase [Eubacterium oxidoreducens]SDB32154.1 alpha-galactosidase [Eubacterium oxidoreducens]